MSTWRADLRARVGALTVDVSLAGQARPVALVGPNGSGKTSILRLIAGLLRPVTAEIEVGGRVLANTEQGIEVPAERRGVGYVPQGSGLFPNLGVLDNVAFGLSVGERRLAIAERRRVARQTLHELGCEHLAERSAEGLSGGERQRVALARALVTEPAILLLDEPLAALDAVARHSVRTFLAQHLRTAGCPSIVVTHEPRDVVALDAMVVALEAGRVVQQGSLDALRRAPATEFVAQFVAVLGDGAPASAGSQQGA